MTHERRHSVMAWRQTRLKHLVSVKAGTWGDEPGVAAMDVRCVRAADFDRVTLRVSTERLPLRSLDRSAFGQLALKPGDIVLEKSGGGADQPVGGSVLYDLDMDAVCSNFAARLRPVPGTEPRFLSYLLASMYFSGVTDALGKQTTGIANLDLGAYLGTACAVPSPQGQRAIADYLDAETERIDALVAARRRQVELIHERVVAAIWRAATRGLRRAQRLPSGLGWVGDMPSHWALPSVGANFEVQLGKMLNPEASQAGELSPYLRNVNVQWDRIDIEDLNEMHFDARDRIRYALEPGDLVVCEGGEVGRVAMWEGAVTGCYYQKALHRVRPRREANARFLLYALWAAASQGVFENEGNTSTFVHLTAEKLRAHRLPWPPSDEQHEIVRLLDLMRDEFGRMKSALERQIDLLLERRQALITAAVTGQLDIPGVAA